MPRIISFTVLRDKLLSREKCQTIRLVKDKTMKDYYRANEVYSAWWKLRTKGAEFLGHVRIKNIRMAEGLNFTEEDAKKEGFHSLLELLITLAGLNKLTFEEMRSVRWQVIEFEWLNKQG